MDQFKTAPNRSLDGMLTSTSINLHRIEFLCGEILSAIIGPPPAAGTDAGGAARYTGLAEAAADLDARTESLGHRMEEVHRLLRDQGGQLVPAAGGRP